MSCSEQSASHGQAADPVWFFSELLFQSVAAKKEDKCNCEMLHGITRYSSFVAERQLRSVATGGRFTEREVPRRDDLSLTSSRMTSDRFAVYD